MDVMEAMRTRKSIRAYKPDRVPKELIEKILSLATRAPSAMNTQPWQITVLAGKVLDEIRRENVRALQEGKLSSQDFVPVLEGIYRKRQVDLAAQIFQLMGIGRHDQDKREKWMNRGFRYFDAPVAVILSIEKNLKTSILSICDIGILGQSICLVALEFGLGTCIENQGIFFPEVLRKLAGIPETSVPIMCVAMGYPDWDFPANRLETPREALDNNTRWYGFEE